MGRYNFLSPNMYFFYFPFSGFALKITQLVVVLYNLSIALSPLILQSDYVIFLATPIRPITSDKFNILDFPALI